MRRQHLLLLSNALMFASILLSASVAKADDWRFSVVEGDPSQTDSVGTASVPSLRPIMDTRRN